MKKLVRAEKIEDHIVLIRGQKVMLDRSLAELYGVVVGRLNEAVKRNMDRFPSDFMFQLTGKEFGILISQFAISSSKWGGRRHAPYAFTEQGVAMLSSVLRSKRAVRVNIVIMRTFVKLRRFLSAHKKLAQKLSQLERRVAKHDEDIQGVFHAIRELMAPPEKPKREIGFHVRYD